MNLTLLKTTSIYNAGIALVMEQMWCNNSKDSTECKVDLGPIYMVLGNRDSSANQNPKANHNDDVNKNITKQKV